MQREPEDEFFNPDLMVYFRNEEYYDDTNVNYAWYIYVHKLLPCVNSQWQQAMNDGNLRKKASIHKHISISDEALVRWIINCKYPALQAEKKAGWPAPANPPTKGKKKGKHDSSAYIGLYSTIYSTIAKSRSDKANNSKWNNLFWNTISANQPVLFQAISRINADTMTASDADMLPGLDPAIDQTADDDDDANDQ
jgi:hypothetical protein